SLADGDLVDANDGRRGRASQTELLGHVLLVQVLDGLPIEVQLLGDGFDCAIPATLADIEGEPLRIERVVGQPVEVFGLHAATAPTIDPAHSEGQVDAPIATGQVAHMARPMVILLLCGMLNLYRNNDLRPRKTACVNKRT